MREIPLTQGKVALVDDEDYEELSEYKWYALKVGNTFYAVRNSTKQENESGYPATICMHRQILGIILSPLQVDHINGGGFDNRKSNLRITTQRQNRQNLHIKQSSIYPGVCWNKGHNKWQACIRINGKQKYLGYFSTELEAFQAYKNANDTLGLVMVDQIAPINTRFEEVFFNAGKNQAFILSGEGKKVRQVDLSL